MFLRPIPLPLSGFFCGFVCFGSLCFSCGSVFRFCFALLFVAPPSLLFAAASASRFSPPLPSLARSPQQFGSMAEPFRGWEQILLPLLPHFLLPSEAAKLSASARVSHATLLQFADLAWRIWCTAWHDSSVLRSVVSRTYADDVCVEKPFSHALYMGVFMHYCYVCLPIAPPRRWAARERRDELRAAAMLVAPHSRSDMPRRMLHVDWHVQTLVGIISLTTLSWDARRHACYSEIMGTCPYPSLLVTHAQCFLRIALALAWLRGACIPSLPHPALRRARPATPAVLPQLHSPLASGVAGGRPGCRLREARSLSGGPPAMSIAVFLPPGCCYAPCESGARCVARGVCDQARGHEVGPSGHLCCACFRLTGSTQSSILLARRGTVAYYVGEAYMVHRCGGCHPMLSLRCWGGRWNVLTHQWDDYPVVGFLPSCNLECMERRFRITLPGHPTSWSHTTANRRAFSSRIGFYWRARYTRLWRVFWGWRGVRTMLAGRLLPAITARYAVPPQFVDVIFQFYAPAELAPLRNAELHEWIHECMWWFRELDYWTRHDVFDLTDSWIAYFW